MPLLVSKLENPVLIVSCSKLVSGGRVCKYFCEEIETTPDEKFLPMSHGFPGRTILLLSSGIQVSHITYLF